MSPPAPEGVGEKQEAAPTPPTPRTCAERRAANRLRRWRGAYLQQAAGLWPESLVLSRHTWRESLTRSRWAGQGALCHSWAPTPDPPPPLRPPVGIAWVLFFYRERPIDVLLRTSLHFFSNHREFIGLSTFWVWRGQRQILRLQSWLQVSWTKPAASQPGNSRCCMEPRPPQPRSAAPPRRVQTRQEKWRLAKTE